MKYCYLLFLAFFIGGCVATKIPGEGTKEATVYSEKCSGCHALPHPKRHNYQQWEQVVGMMEKRMNERNYIALEAEEKKAILTYLQTHSR